MNLIQFLMRGGNYGYYWLKQSTRTVWWKTSEISKVPFALEDIYFGVHPSSIQKGPKERATIKDIQAINCLYVDLDLEDFDDDNSLLLAHIKKLHHRPSVIISSGGGYHCYWLLEEPFILDTNFKRDIAIDMQKRWVLYIGGDLAALDIARILRVPGTKNYKYEGDPLPVKTVYTNYDNLYSLITLQEALPEKSISFEDEDDEDSEINIPQPVRPNDLNIRDIIDLAKEAANGQKFLQLHKNIDGNYASSSEADLAYCEILAFWTGGDYEKMDKIFHSSDRMRVKWNRKDYKYDTLTKAIRQTSSFYTDPGGLLTAGAHDEGNASCTYAKIKDVVAFNEALGWLQYKNAHWEAENSAKLIEDAIIDTLKARRAAAAKIENSEDILRATNPTAQHMLNAKRLLQRKVTISISEFDISLDELNCLNGVLNLKTGELLPHHYKHRFTYCLPVKYNPDATSELWQTWLLDTVGDKQDIVDFLQLALGYSLSGRTQEELMFYIWGPARGGKGVFTETIISLLGKRPLATEVDIELFMAKESNSGRANFSLAALKAARFVAASESKENEWLNAKRIKQWTGNNFVTAAHKYGRDFTYSPQFKIWLTSNFPPQMNADDDAAWGRIKIIEFPNSHLGHEDKTLKSRMLEPNNLEGILAWMVKGAIEWYKLGGAGLKPPQTIINSTKDARDDVDWVSIWIQEDIILTDNSKNKITSADYYQEYKDWCMLNGVSTKGIRALNRSLKQSGYDVNVPASVNGHTKRCWVGAKLTGPINIISGLKGKPLMEDE